VIRLLHGWHYAGFTVSAVMVATGLALDSKAALLCGLGILIVTLVSIYELRRSEAKDADIAGG
jgi:hypothetical protein